MGSVTNWNETCNRCGNETRFHNYECRTGEGYDVCSACGAEAIGRICRDKLGRFVHNRKRIALSSIKVRFANLYTGKTIAEFRLPKAFAIDHPAKIYDFSAEEWIEFMKQYGVQIHADLKDAFVCLYFRTKGKKRRWVRFNYVGNWLENIGGGKSGYVILCRAKWYVSHHKGYGAMCVSYPGDRLPYYRTFKSVPNIPHILRKWNRMTATPYDPEHSYLTVMDGEKLVFLKGELRCTEDDA